MTPALGFILAGLFATAPMAHAGSRPPTPAAIDVAQECPPTYKLTRTRAGEPYCLRYRRDLPR